MRVAITGATGFLGVHLVAALESNGDEVIRIRRDDAGDLVAPSTSERADALVHLAFPTDAAERRGRPAATLRAVARNAGDAVAIAERLGATHLVLASTGKVYGTPAVLPIDDVTRPNPTTQLGELKLLAEEVFAHAARSAGFGTTRLRIFNAYGPGQGGSFLIPALLAGIARGALSLGELDHGRDWIHVEDVARGFVAALEAPPSVGEARAWNVASGRAHPVREILDALRRAGANVPDPVIDPVKLRPREAPEERASCEALRAHGWWPRVSLDVGLAGLLARQGRHEPGASVTVDDIRASEGGAP